MLTYLSFLRLLCIVSFFKSAVAEPHRFKKWFPRYENAFSNLTRGNCSTEYQIYAEDSIGNATIYPDLEIWQIDDTISPILNCLLEETPELYKTILASSQVLLGLMPSILVNVGPSLHETAILQTYGKRHILGVLVGLGSPSVLFDNTVGLRELVANILSPKDSIPTSLLWGPNHVTIILEYIMVLAAIANIVEVCYEIGVRSALTISQEEQSLPAIWICIGALIHILGGVILRFAQKKRQPRSLWVSCLNFNLLRWLKRQFSPRVEIEPIEFELRPCSVFEMVFSWLAGILATVNIIWGTVLFSSILFAPLEEALWIVLRIMLSAILCRIVVRYEICAIREQNSSDQELGRIIAPVPSDDGQHESS